MRLPRLADWIAITVVLTLAIGIIAPQQLSVTLYKLSLVSMAGVVGYWFDRSLFPYARPDSFIARGMQEEAACDIDLDDCKLIPWDDGLVFAMAMLRRAIIVGSAMLSIGLGA